MQNKIKSILFTTLLLSTSISSLTAMDPAGASSASHRQAQQEAQLPAISYEDLMAFILPEFYSIDFKGKNIDTLRQFMPAELQGKLVDFSQRMNNIGDTNKAIIKKYFTITPTENLTKLEDRQVYNGHVAKQAEWAQLYQIHFDKNAAVNDIADGQTELVSQFPDIDGFMMLYFPDTGQDFSPQAMAAEQLRLTGPDVPLALPWRGKTDNWLTHPLDHELGLNTLADFLKMFFVPNGNAFPEIRLENKKTLTDGSEVVLRLGDSVGNGVAKNLFAQLRGTTAFQNTYDIPGLLQNPDYRMPGNIPEVKWDESKKQYYVDIPGFGTRGYAERAGQIIGWPAFHQYIAVDVVKASPSFAMLMKARELAKQVMSSSMDSVLKRDITNENREALRETLAAFLKNIKSLNLDELAKMYGRYDIFEWLKQKKEEIAVRIEALGPVRAQPQAQPQQPPRQAPQAGAVPQAQPQQGASYAMPDITNGYEGMTEVKDNSGLWAVNPNQVTDEYKKSGYQNAKVLWLDGQTKGDFSNYGSIVLPEKTEVFKVKMFIVTFWNLLIPSLFGNLGNSNGEINNPNLKVLDIYALSSLSSSNSMSNVARFLNQDNKKQYFQNRPTPFIIYNHPHINKSPEKEQVLYFDPETKTFSVKSVAEYMTQYRHKMSGTPPQAGPSQEQARAERERAQEQARAEQARRAQEQARAEQARRAQEQARANAGAAPAQPSQSNISDQVWSQLKPYLSNYDLQISINKVSGGNRLTLSSSMFKPVAFINGVLRPEVWNIISQLPLKELQIDKSIPLPEVGSQYYAQDSLPHPEIYEVPSSILVWMRTLEKLTIDRNDGVIFPDISRLPNLKQLTIGSDYRAETRIYLLKKNVDIFMARAQGNRDLYFSTGLGPIHGMKIIGLKNPDDFYAMNSFMRKYGNNNFGFYRIAGNG